MRGSKNQKSAAIKPRRNRYVAGAKLSEHKFLRILRGYAEGVPIQALEPTTHVSGKSIRATYGSLRCNLPSAAQRERTRFAGAGSLLFDAEGMTPEGCRILARVEGARRFNRYIKRHAPRLKSGEDEQLFALEKTVRILCALDLRGVAVDHRLLAQIAEAFTTLRPSEPLQKLADAVSGAKPHAHPELRLYEDYRRYLLKRPLGTE